MLSFFTLNEVGTYKTSHYFVVVYLVNVRKVDDFITSQFFLLWFNWFLIVNCHFYCVMKRKYFRISNIEQKKPIDVQTRNIANTHTYISFHFVQKSYGFVSLSMHKQDKNERQWIKWWKRVVSPTIIIYVLKNCCENVNFSLWSDHIHTHISMVAISKKKKKKRQQ